MVPSLSVVLPTYNAGGWLPDTLGHLRTAIERAGWPDVQIVVVDDGSTDDTPEVLAADLGAPSLTVVRQANGGRFAAREAGWPQPPASSCCSSTRGCMPTPTR